MAGSKIFRLGPVQARKTNVRQTLCAPGCARAMRRCVAWLRHPSSLVTCPAYEQRPQGDAARHWRCHPAPFQVGQIPVCAVQSLCFQGSLLPGEWQVAGNCM